MNQASQIAKFMNRCLFAAVLIPTDAPLGQRIQILSKFFTPAPGGTIEILPTQARDHGTVKKDTGKLFGEIRVSPPKGSCFTITTDIQKRDIEVCKSSTLKWRLEDLDVQTGQLKWKVKTSIEDFGSEISWQTPYTIARTLPLTANFYQANSTPVFIKSCTPTLGRSDGSMRRLTFGLFNGKQWIMKFPHKDLPIPPLPPPKSNILEKLAAGAKGEVKDSGHGEPPASAAETGHGQDVKAAPPPAEPEPEAEQWTINTRRGFEMSVENFITDGSMPPGKTGKCRYVYDYIPGDNRIGRIECHHGDQFLYFYAFLRCMGPIIP